MSITAVVHCKIKFILMLAVMLGLMACGGGSGGSKGALETATSSLAAGSSPDIRVAFNKSSLSFNYIEGTEPEAQLIIGAFSANLDQDPYISAVVSGDGVAAGSVVSSMSAGKALIQIFPNPSLSAGTYKGTITVSICPTATCTLHYTGSPFTLNYQITVVKKLAASLPHLTITSPESSAGASKEIALTLPSTNSVVKTSISYAAVQPQWLSGQVTGDKLTVQVRPTSLLPGIYTANLILDLADKSQSLTIPVTFEVSNGFLTPEMAALTITSETTLQEMQQSTRLSLASGVTASSWSATSDQSWLKLDNNTGAFDKPLTWHIDLTAFNKLANQKVHKAIVTLKADTGMAAQSLIVEANKNLSEIKSLDAVALVAGQEGELTLYGNGFNLLDVPTIFLSIANTTPSAVTRLGDGVLSVKLPALNQGDYQVTLKTASGLLTATKTLKVTSRDAYTYQALPTQGLKSSIIWDSVSKSAFVVNQSLKSLMRFAAVDGSFQLVTTRNFDSIYGIAMSPDHTALILQSGDNKIFKLSPTDLSTQIMFDLQSKLPRSENFLNVPLPIMGDNRVMTSYGWVELDTGELVPFLSPRGMGQLASWAAVAGNGQRMLWPDSGTISSPAPAMWFDLANAEFNPVGFSVEPKFFYRYAVNHDGSSWAINDQVLNFDFTIKGKIKAPSFWYGNETALSRSGDRLYYYLQSTEQDNARIYVFDTSVPMTTQLNFPILGFIEVKDRPNCAESLRGSYIYNCESFSTKLAIADDDQTLFLAGDANFLVVPISEKFRTATF